VRQHRGPDCDGLNTSAFVANMSLPLSSNDMAVRIDHAFSSKWNWFASYRYYKLTQASSAQTDIGGFFPGDKLGVPASVATRPQQPWYLVTGLTTSITTNLTNDFHYSFLRNYWQWGDENAPPQVSGLGGAMEPFGKTAQNVLAPYTVATQSIPHAFLGRAGQLLQRQPLAAERQPPAPVRRTVPAQLQLPPAQRQRRAVSTSRRPTSWGIRRARAWST